MLQRGQGAVCSPAVHDCCSPTCQILERQEEEPCGGDEECLQYAYCDGVHYICPTPQVKNNGTLCRGGTRVSFHYSHEMFQIRKTESWLKLKMWPCESDATSNDL